MVTRLLCNQQDDLACSPLPLQLRVLQMLRWCWSVRGTAAHCACRWQAAQLRQPAQLLQQRCACCAASLPACLAQHGELAPLPLAVKYTTAQKG